MTKLRYRLSVLALTALATGCGVSQTNTATTSATNAPAQNQTATMSDKVTKTEDEWKQTLTPEQYEVLRQKGTERAFTGKYWNTKDKGTYKCAGCGEELFVSDTKYDSGCGWPSFYAPATNNVITEASDNTLKDFVGRPIARTEVICSKCGGHLGHVFDDGPKPTGLRYCINSASIKFEPKKEKEEKK